MLLSKIWILFRNQFFSTNVLFHFGSSPEFPWWLKGEESSCQCRIHRFDPWVGKISGEGNGNHSSILAWEIPWTVEPVHEVSKESDMTWRLDTSQVTMLHSVSSLFVCRQCSTVAGSLQTHGPSRLLCLWDSPGKNTGLGSLLQGIFLTQGSNLCLSCLPHWQAGSLPLCHLDFLSPPLSP